MTRATLAATVAVLTVAAVGCSGDATEQHPDPDQTTWTTVTTPSRVPVCDLWELLAGDLGETCR